MKNYYLKIYITNKKTEPLIDTKGNTAFITIPALLLNNKEDNVILKICQGLIESKNILKKNISSISSIKIEKIPQEKISNIIYHLNNMYLNDRIQLHFLDVEAHSIPPIWINTDHLIIDNCKFKEIELPVATKLTDIDIYNSNLENIKLVKNNLLHLSIHNSVILEKNENLKKLTNSNKLSSLYLYGENINEIHINPSLDLSVNILNINNETQLHIYGNLTEPISLNGSFQLNSDKNITIKHLILNDKSKITQLNPLISIDNLHSSNSNLTLTNYHSNHLKPNRFFIKNINNEDEHCQDLDISNKNTMFYLHHTCGPFINNTYINNDNKYLLIEPINNEELKNFSINIQPFFMKNELFVTLHPDMISKNKHVNLNTEEETLVNYIEHENINKKLNFSNYDIIKKQKYNKELELTILAIGEAFLINQTPGKNKQKNRMKL